MRSWAELGRAHRALQLDSPLRQVTLAAERSEEGRETWGGLPPAPLAASRGVVVGECVPTREACLSLCYLWQPWLRNCWERRLCLSPSST